MIRGKINTGYLTQQTDLFESGLAGEIGMNALGVWLAVKSHASLENGEAWPGVRRIMAVTGLASKTVQNALETLKANHLLREVRRKGRSIVYIARERLDVRVGSRVVCTVVFDYVPKQMRKRLDRLEAAAAGNLEAADVWSEVDILPGSGFAWDAARKVLTGRARADEVLAGVDGDGALPDLTDKPAVEAAREQLRRLALEFGKPAKKSPRNSQRPRNS